ncbi:MAG: PAS domain S-box protein, partial [Rhodoferax sp.]
MTSQVEASPDPHPVAKNIKTFFIGWLVLFAVGVLASIMAFEHFSGIIKRKAHDDLQAIAVAKKEQIESFIQERHGDASLLVARAPVWQFLDPRGGPVQPPDLKTLLDLTLQQTRDAYGYRAITLFNTALRQMTGPVDLPLHPTERAALQRVLDTRHSTFVDMHLQPDGTPGFGVAHPIFARGEPTRAVVGVAYLEMDATTGLYPRLVRWPVASQSAESLLLRREGEEIVYLSPLRFAPEAIKPLSLRRPVRDTSYTIPTETSTTQPALIERNDYRQVRVIAAPVPIEGTNWIMVAKVDYAEVNEPVSALRITRLVSGGLLGMLLLVGTRLLWHARQMANTAARLRQDARYVAAAQASIDGYLVLDDIGRIIEVNDALVRMTGYSHRELY